MLILWNHGGGAFGYGMDSIYNGMFSLADIREALAGAYEPNEKDPAFDIIGFDACLMSSLEAVHALNGFASYYAVSEETEPGDGWDYSPWLKAMTEDPTMSPAKVARNIADSYMDYYMTQNVNIGWLITSDVTFSVLDAEEFTINGIRGASDLSSGLFNMDPFNYLINSRMNTEVKKGDVIVPLYDVDSAAMCIILRSLATRCPATASAAVRSTRTSWEEITKMIGCPIT